MLSVEYKFDLLIRVPYNYMPILWFSDFEGYASLKFS